MPAKEFYKNEYLFSEAYLAEITQIEANPDVAATLKTLKEFREFAHTYSLNDWKHSYIHISYKRLFSPYLKGAKTVRIVDPYIRLDYQIKNFIAFCDVIDSAENRVAVKLVTSAENKSLEEEVSFKFEEMKRSLAQEGIDFSYEFDDKIHDRLIETDSGWRVKPGRGLDIFQKPETWYGFEELDQTKRKCRATEIDYFSIT